MSKLSVTEILKPVYKLCIILSPGPTALKIYDCLNIKGVIPLTPICRLRKQKHVGKHFTNFAFGIYQLLIRQSFYSLRSNGAGA